MEEIDGGWECCTVGETCFRVGEMEDVAEVMRWKMLQGW